MAAAPAGRGARVARAALGTIVLLSVAAACGGSEPAGPAAPAQQRVQSAAAHLSPRSSTSSSPASVPAPGSGSKSTSVPATRGRPTRPSSSSSPAVRARTIAPAPVIVVDPGHSRSVSAVDPATGLTVSDYENEPEMHDVFAVAQLVRAQLQAAGYRVVMTKPTVNSRVSLGERAAIANRAHAALALSIHDQAGANGGLPFASSNNISYYQSVGTYRATPSGRRVYFTNRVVAAASRRYGAVFRQVRSRLEHHAVRLQANVGYDLGTRGLAAGNIWLVQLLSHVPWIYNEAGGNSAGRIGLDLQDRRSYAAALVAAVERCVPIRRR